MAVAFLIALKSRAFWRQRSHAIVATLCGLFFLSGKLPHGGNSDSGFSELAALATDCLNNSQGACKQMVITVRYIHKVKDPRKSGKKGKIYMNF